MGKEWQDHLEESCSHESLLADWFKKAVWTGFLYPSPAPSLSSPLHSSGPQLPLWYLLQKKNKEGSPAPWRDCCKGIMSQSFNLNKDRLRNVPHLFAFVAMTYRSLIKTSKISCHGIFSFSQKTSCRTIAFISTNKDMIHSNEILLPPEMLRICRYFCQDNQKMIVCLFFWFEILNARCFHSNLINCCTGSQILYCQYVLFFYLFLYQCSSFLIQFFLKLWFLKWSFCLTA